MTDIVIVSTGQLGEALAAALVDTGVTVVMVERVTPFADCYPGTTLAELDLGAVMREVEPVEFRSAPRAQVARWPLQAQARPPARWRPRQREQRTRGGR